MPRFVSQIRQQQSLNITDPEAVRFIMSRQQAASLLLQACALASGGEVFIYKMPAIRLGDLVQMLIEEVCQHYNMIYTGRKRIIGLFPGERAYEQLIAEEEAPHTWETNDMFIYSPGRKPRISANGRYCRQAGLQNYCSVAGSHEDVELIRHWIRQYLELESSEEPEAVFVV
jgi:UDP-N-acetylglucosamine 4,6-dehydratase